MPALAMLLVVALGWTATTACRGDRHRDDVTLLVFAASSLEEAMKEVVAAHQAGGASNVELNTAGSNVLAQQIRAGAPADVFVSADARWIDELVGDGVLDGRTRRDLLGNRLVVIGHPRAERSLDRLEDLGKLGFRHLSLADPDSVPAGRYARSALEATVADGDTVWDQVAERLAPAPDVRAALALVAAERDAVGIVYATDARAAPGVEVLLEIEREPDPPIRYVVALVRRGAGKDERAGDSAAPQRFLDFLSTEEARGIFARHGFLPLP